ncbi:MAG: GNAT family N-acetyltransferase [Planctomycetia bacterium]|nr:GNAT family N-acetyltransferase [Planctomycetia bacterium]
MLFRRASSLDEIDALEQPWRELGSQVGYPLSQFSWTRACASAFAAEATPHVLAGLRQNKLVALAPLESKRLHGIRRLLLAGASELYEPMDLAWTDQRDLERMIAVLARSGSPMFLQRIPADSLGLQKLKRIYRGRAIVITRPQPACPYIELDESWLEPEQHLNSGRRSDLRRARRKAEHSGAVTTEIRTPELDDLPDLLDTAFEVEANSWKGGAGTALVHDAHRAVFYRQFAEAACVEGILRICFLRIGDRVAAMQMALEQGGGFWLLKVGYDQRFAACSPGQLLLRDTIRYAVEAGLESYEFLGTAESWTEVWTKTQHQCVSVRVYPLGVRGMAALAADAAVIAYRRWRMKQCG